MGRPPKALELNKKNFTKEELRIRQENEQKLKMSADKLRPPVWLDKDAKKEFRRIVREMSEIDLLANVDIALLAIYADCYSGYIKASKKISENGLTVLHTNKSGATNEVESPYVKIQIKYATQIKQIASEFGLSVNSRLRLTLPKQEEDIDYFGSKFD